MAQPEDLIVKQLQTNIAQHEGRIAEAEAEGGAASRIVQNAILEGEIAEETFDSINESIIEPIKARKEKQEKQKKIDAWSENPSEQQRADLLFGRKSADDIVGDRLFGRDPYGFQDIGKLDKDYATEALTSMNDKDLQTVYRSGLISTWIDENGDYTSELLADQNSISDEGLKLMVASKNDKNLGPGSALYGDFAVKSDLETLAYQTNNRSIDEHDGPSDTDTEEQGEGPYSHIPNVNPQTGVPYAQEKYKATLDEMLKSYSWSKVESKRTNIFGEKGDARKTPMKNMFQRMKYNTIKKALRKLEEGKNIGYWKDVLKKKAPDIHEHMYRELEFVDYAREQAAMEEE
tara:strand:+ start:3777 stop:4817 length:1041 start_codon:yes stop_codon:yes gene_type:complete